MSGAGGGPKLGVDALGNGSTSTLDHFACLAWRGSLNVSRRGKRGGGVDFVLKGPCRMAQDRQSLRESGLWEEPFVRELPELTGDGWCQEGLPSPRSATGGDRPRPTPANLLAYRSCNGTDTHTSAGCPLATTHRVPDPTVEDEPLACRRRVGALTLLELQAAVVRHPDQHRAMDDTCSRGTETSPDATSNRQ